MTPKVLLLSYLAAADVAAIVLASGANLEGEDEACALQVHHQRALVAKHLKAEEDQLCEVGAHVACPGSGNMCAGEQCCQGIDGGKTFPCPSAPLGFTGCESDVKIADCLSCKVGDHVACPGSGSMCAGAQCCPGPDGGKTFPCPSAPADFTGCESESKTLSCLAEDDATNTFEAECSAWVNADGPKPSVCDDKPFDSCYKGLPPVSAEEGVFCVAGEISTCEDYCKASGLCPPDFCEMPFDAECSAWVNADGPKPTVCDDTPFDACYKGVPPVSADEGVFCVAGEISTCEGYCKASGLCPPDFCETPFDAECSAWVNADGPKPTVCDNTPFDACYKGVPPVSAEEGVFCVAGEISTCDNYCKTSGLCLPDFCETPFDAECSAWVNGDGPKPSVCDDTPFDACYKGLPPVSAEEGVFCVLGEISTCENYCKISRRCPPDFCETP